MFNKNYVNMKNKIYLTPTKNHLNKMLKATIN